MSDAVNDPEDAREELLMRLVSDEPSPLEAFERSELAGDAEARRELEELLAIADRYETLGHREHADLREATEQGVARAEDRTLEALRAHVRGAGSSPPGTGSGTRWIAALAALALAALGGWWMTRSDPEPDADTPLGGGEALAIEAPIGQVPDFAEVRWTGELPRDGYFRVSVFDAGDPEQEEALAHSPELRENRWPVPEHEWRTWPTTIRLYVEAFGETAGDLVERSREVRASRTP